jgi:hypothetical protein
MLAGVGNAEEKGGRMSEALLPNTTQGFVAISNVDSLRDHWNKTQLGHLMADPAMEPFAKDLRRQFEDRWSNVHERLGLTLDDMKGVPGGDVGIGLVAPAPGKAALAIVIDVTGKQAEAKAMLKKVSENQLKRGAKRSEVTVADCADPVVQFDLPELEEEKEASLSTLRGSDKAEADKAAAADKNTTKKEPLINDEKAAARQAFYCLTGNLLAVTDNLDVMKGILIRAAGKETKDASLASHQAFQTVFQRCQKDYKPKATSQIRWFIHPLGYVEAARAATPADRRRKGKSILEVFRNQGVGGVKGIGGFFDFDSEGYEMVHRTAIFAPPPREKAMKIAVLPNHDDFKPQAWVPRDVATYTTFYFDIQNAFDNFGSIFDELFGQGETGVWIEVKQSLKEDPSGPQIDLSEDLVKHLGQRITIVTDYQVPITTTSERLFFAIEAKNPKAVAAGIKKLLKNDPTAKCREIEGQVIWEMVEDDTPVPEAPDVTFGDAPAVTPVHPMKKRKKRDSDDEEEKEPRLLPHAAITVWQGNLIIASHIDFLKKVLTPPKKAEKLVDDVDWKLVYEQMDKWDPKAKCLRVFSRTDEEYRPTYELIRLNKMPESETMLAKLLRGLFGEGKKGQVRKQKIDGSQLPEYQIVRRYLGPAGFQATTEPNGWYMKGFTLSKESK